ncbi:MAG: MotA/TolQ/ExbB proton channel family protein [Lentisphaerae bacterium]|nr:MotA/TolQ/ExbB proton channel family protein [Lentisphaerota bacterium]
MLKPRFLLAAAAVLILTTGGPAPLRAQTAAPPAAAETGTPALAAPPAPLPVPLPRAEAPVIERAEAPAPRGPAGETATRTFGMSWREAWHYGGTIMWFILALSIIGGALSIYLFIILRPAQIAPRALRSELRDRLRDNDLNAARRACESRACPLSAVTLAALDYIRGIPEPDVPLLRDVVESEGSRQAEDLQSQTQFLLDLSVITPMLGLLGTVLGMLKAFGSIAQDYTAAKPVILAQGVSQAIITTIFGLAIAIPCMLLYAYFRRRAVRMIALLETAAADVLATLAGRRSP